MSSQFSNQTFQDCYYTWNSRQMSLSETTSLTFLFPFLGNFVSEWRGLIVSGRNTGISRRQKFPCFPFQCPSLSEWRQNEFTACPLSGGTSLCLSQRMIFESTKSHGVAEHWSSRRGLLFVLNPADRHVLLDPHRPAAVLSGVREALWKWRIPQPVVLHQESYVLS